MELHVAVKFNTVKLPMFAKMSVMNALDFNLMLNHRLCVDAYHLRVDDCISYQMKEVFEAIINARAAPKIYLIQKCLTINSIKDQSNK